MRVPQEIVDAIIDNVWMESLDVWNVERNEAGTLRACALTSRAFLPTSQKHLFSEISCFQDKDWKTRIWLFNELLINSPHIGLLVRQFRLEAVSDEPLSYATLLSGILSRLPNLTGLDVESLIVHGHPARFPSAVQGALPILAIRTLRLCKLTFHDPAELDSLLSHATSLEDLSLDHITFRNNSVHLLAPSAAAAVVLVALKVEDMDVVSVDAMLATFRAVDIKHLRYLDVKRAYLPESLLLANTQTLEKIRYFFLYVTPGQAMNQNILAGNTRLRSIELIESNNDVGITLSTFGDLAHLTALKTVSLHFTSALDNEPSHNNININGHTLAQLNTLLALAGNTLEAVRIYAFAYKMRRLVPDLADVRDWLPSVAQKLSVHVPTHCV
ncbi:hypothetical protein C8J57DRAFT_1502378 [Mycena rebaudengoi]|nr:hypothetical protein C8J57DRAFT_1502378 [Mycena rebaudengoi]